MSHESVITELKKLIKQDLFEIDPGEHFDHFLSESDRSAIILGASMVEAFILSALKRRMPTINADEQDRLFNFEGPCGSYSNRIRMVQALGIIDRPTRRQIELVKEMRNAAAHCHTAIQFDTPAIVDAIAHLVPVAFRDEVLSADRAFLRALYDRLCSNLNMAVCDPSAMNPYEEIMQIVRESQTPERKRRRSAKTSRGKSPGA